MDCSGAGGPGSDFLRIEVGRWEERKRGTGTFLKPSKKMKQCQITQLLMSAPQPEIRSPDIRSSLVLLGHTTGLPLFCSSSCSLHRLPHLAIPHGPFFLAPALPTPLPLSSTGVHLSNLPSAPPPHPTPPCGSKCSHHHPRRCSIHIYNLIFPKSNSLFPKRSPPLGSIYIVGITIFKTSMSPLTLFFSGNTSIEFVVQG